MSLKGGLSDSEIRKAIADNKLSEYVANGTISPERYNEILKIYRVVPNEKPLKKNKKLFFIGLILLIICLTCIVDVFAHKGRTDGNGGHRDNNNQSGLGSYHFHCGGYPAHLHKNGVCPYKSVATSSSSNTKTSSSQAKTSSKYDEGYDDGYDKGYVAGYDEGYDNGYDIGWDKGYDGGRSDEKIQQKRLTTKRLKVIIPFLSVIMLYLCYKAFFSKKK